MIVCHNCFHRLSGLTMWTIDESEGHARRAHSEGHVYRARGSGIDNAT